MQTNAIEVLIHGTRQVPDEADPQNDPVARPVRIMTGTVTADDLEYITGIEVRIAGTDAHRGRLLYFPFQLSELAGELYIKREPDLGDDQ